MQKTKNERPEVSPDASKSHVNIGARMFTLQDSVAISKMLCLEKSEQLSLAEEILNAVQEIQSEISKDSIYILSEARK